MDFSEPRPPFTMHLVCTLLMTFIHPPTPRRVFSGVRGWWCTKFGPAWTKFCAAPLSHPLLRSQDKEVLAKSRKGGLSKGAFCAKQTFLQGNGLPSAVLQGNGLPSAVVTRHPLGLGKSAQSRTGLGSCKSHLQVQTPQGRSLASASGSGQAIDLCFERSPFK